MGSSVVENMDGRPHAVCIPYPKHGHINPMFKLAKLLHHKGFHVTFVNSEYNHKRFLRSNGGELKGTSSFVFETIPDGLPPSDEAEAQDDVSLLKSTSEFCLAPFKELLAKLNQSSNVPPVSCIVSDMIMRFTYEAAHDLGIPGVSFWPLGAYTTFVMYQMAAFMEKGYLPLTEESRTTNAYVDTPIEGISGINAGMCLGDIPTNLITFLGDFDMEFSAREGSRIDKASGFIIHTFEELESVALKSFRTTLPYAIPSTYAIGPLNLLEEDQAIACDDKDLQQLELNQWKGELECLKWLDSKGPNSVIYVNFGTSSFTTPTQLVEFACGLANSNQLFLWIIRPDLVLGDKANVLPAEFLESTKLGRGMVASWCPQEKVLGHNAIGGFLTHSGWNSVMESLSFGIPMICWPSYGDQPTNCWTVCEQWRIGMKLKDVKRDVVERLVRELLTGDEGKEMKKRVMKLKNLAHGSGKKSSLDNLDKLINEVLLSPPKRTS